MSYPGIFKSFSILGSMLKRVNSGLGLERRKNVNRSQLTVCRQKKKEGATYRALFVGAQLRAICRY